MLLVVELSHVVALQRQRAQPDRAAADRGRDPAQRALAEFTTDEPDFAETAEVAVMMQDLRAAG